MTYHQICNKSNTSDATSGAGTANLSGAPEFTLVFLRVVSLDKSCVFCVVFCWSLFVLLFFFPWPFYCLLFFKLWFLNTTLVSSNFSYQTWTRINIFSLIKFILILLVHHECTRFSQTFFSYIWLMPNDFVCEIDTFIFHLVKAIHRIKTQIYNWVTMTTFWNNLIMSKHWQCK
jgi:hypothetical protein